MVTQQSCTHPVHSMACSWQRCAVCLDEAETGMRKKNQEGGFRAGIMNLLAIPSIKILLFSAVLSFALQALAYHLTPTQLSWACAYWLLGSK